MERITHKSTYNGFDNIIDACRRLEIIQIKSDIKPFIPKYRDVKDTVFVNIYQEHEKDYTIFANECMEQEKSEEDFEPHMWNTLKNIIRTTWSMDKLHVIAHSGGYDSRILSTILSELRDEMGAAWIGDIIFVEAFGESIESLEILKRNKWSRCGYAIDYRLAKNYMSDYILNVSTMPQKFTNVTSYPMNFFYDPYLYLQHAGLFNNKDAVQFYSMFYCNEIDDLIKSYGWKTWLYAEPRKQVNEWKFYFDDVVLPCLTIDYIKAMYKYNKVSQSPKRVAECLCHYKCSHLKDVIRPDLKVVQDRLTLSLSTIDYGSVNMQYKNTFYGKRNPTMFNSNIEYLECWLKYCLAGFVELLHSENKDVICW